MRSLLLIALLLSSTIAQPLLAQPIPQANSATKPATSDAKARALLTAARTAIGGDALLQVKALNVSNTAVIHTEQGDVTLSVETTIKYPDKLLNKISIGGNIVTTQGYNGNTGWLASAKETGPVSASATAEYRNIISHDNIAMLATINNINSVQLLAPEKIADQSVNVLAISLANGHNVKLYLDANNLIVRKEFPSNIDGNTVTVQENYSDYRENSGIKLPYKKQIYRDGQLFADTTTTAVQVNPTITDQSFAQPTAQ